MSIIDRRSFVVRSLLGGTGLLLSPTIAYAAAETDRRLLFIIQRGAADGLGILAPVGDPAYAGLRRDLAKTYAGLPVIDGMFALHPALKRISALHSQNQALFVHAVASAYRDRSHFDAQNLLEIGGARPYERSDGWLNRLVGLLPSPRSAIAVAPSLPVAMRGVNKVASYAPSRLPDPSTDLLDRVSALYADDPLLHQLWDEAQATRASLSNVDGGGRRDAKVQGELAARLMSGADGANVAMLETGGWDTHSGQLFRLDNQLSSLDTIVGALHDGLGKGWNKTLVIVATEFGRTAAVNGTGGTDHGTGSLLLALGGDLPGSRIVADWPGLAPRQLHEARDLAPTIALEAVISDLCARHFRIDPVLARKTLFPSAIHHASIPQLDR